MSKRKLFVPEFITENIFDITPERLAKRGYRAVIFDVDNTVVEDGLAHPDERTIEYFRTLNDRGIKAALVSNNNRTRMEIFNKNLGVFAVHDAQKPSPNGVHKCIKAFGTPAESVLFVGDQIFTDCLAAHRAGIDCCLVRPIKAESSTFFKLKRFLEKPFLKTFFKSAKSRRCD